LVIFIGAELAEHEISVQRAMVHAVEAVLITIEEAEVVATGQVGEGTSEAIALIGFFAFPDRVIKKARFDGPQPTTTPRGGDHFFDGTFLDFIGRPEPGKMRREELCESLLRFILKNDFFRQKAVTYGIEGRTASSFLCNGTAPERSVGSRCRSGSENRFRWL